MFASHSFLFVVVVFFPPFLTTNKRNSRKISEVEIYKNTTCKN